jgi:hypothetical protein
VDVSFADLQDNLLSGAPDGHGHEQKRFLEGMNVCIQTRQRPAPAASMPVTTEQSAQGLRPNCHGYQSLFRNPATSLSSSLAVVRIVSNALVNGHSSHF